MSKRSYRPPKSLNLNELIEELEKSDDDQPMPTSVTIFPPENANSQITDEDSGDEERVTFQNLSGSQLRARAELNFDRIDSDDSDDDTPLISLAKRRRLDIPDDDEPQTGGGATGIIHESSSIQSHDEPVPSTSSDPITMPSVPKTQSYSWRNRHNPRIFPEWRSMHGPKNLQSPMYYFDCLFSQDVVDLLVRYTNLYAAQKNKIGNVTSDEMKCYIGILLFSGYTVVPRRFMYWEKASDCNYDIVYNAMSRDRLTFIMSHIHCCDNNEILNNSDKFAKLRPLLNILNQKFMEMAPFEEMHSIDEAMVPYYGGHSCKQFIRGKPIRWGYKLWVGATRIGYILWFEPYQGHSATMPSAYKQFGLGGGVILQYADALQGHFNNAPFHLFFDNYFTSIPLIHELGNRGLKATGTIRENRTSKCPLASNKDFKKTERGTHQSKSSQPENILVCKWNDNSVVTVTSNAEKMEPLHKCKRFSQKEKKYVQIDQPALIKAYNENMGGVDRSDQNIGLYRTSIRGKKWYFSLLCHSLDMAVQNAWQLYKIDGGQNDHLSFRRSIARGLLETYKKEEKRGSCSTPKNYRDISRYDGRNNLVKYTESQLRCALCKKKTNFLCKKCLVHLHLKMCFEKYHVQV